MRLIKAPEEDARITKIMQQWYIDNHRGMEIHVSDLETPRKAYFSKLYWEIPPTEREMMLWSMGTGHHHAMVLLTEGIDDSQSASFVDPDSGIHYSPDMLQLQAELKTSRWYEVPATLEEAWKAVQFYEPQCRSYAAFMQDKLRRKNSWLLIVFYLMPYHSGYSSKFPVKQSMWFEWTDEELEETRRELKEKAAQLRKALEEKDHRSLPLCSEKLCLEKVGHGRGKPATMEFTCKYAHLCKPEGRIGLYTASKEVTDEAMDSPQGSIPV